MNNIHIRNNERVQRCITFVYSQPGDFPEDSKAVLLCASLKKEQTRLVELDVVRSSSMSRQRQATAARRHAHKQLDNLVRKVVGTGHVIAFERTDVEGMFVRPQKNASSQTLIADGRSIAEKAAPLVALFTENGLPPAFINDLRSYADSIEHSIQIQTESVDERVRANAEMKEIIRHMNELIEHLDIIVRNKYANDPAKLAAWESARRLEHAPRANRNGGTDTTTPAQQQ